MGDVIEHRARLTRLFPGSFRVGDISESLLSFDAERAAGGLWTILRQRRFSEAGVREHGVMTGYVLDTEIEDYRGPCGDRQPTRREHIDDRSTCETNAWWERFLEKEITH